MRILLICTFFFCHLSLANDIFDLELKRENPHEKSLLWGPLFNFLLPGVDQFYEGQYKSAFIYSGTAALSVYLMNSANYDSDIKEDEQSFNDNENDEFRKEQYGMQLYMTAGGLAAFHSYRSAVKYKKEKWGAYSFLPDEDVGDLISAPFDFHFLKEKTTYLPLLFVTGLVLSLEPHGLSTGNFSSSDAFFTSAYSFNAGVNEEALFRGMMMPNFYQSYGSLFWSNATTALIFGAAHGVKTLPWPQILVGHYLGWLTQKNNWSLREAIFVHTWWDVIAIGATYMQGRAEDQLLFIPLYAKSF